jgi:hypothetical protein
MARAGKAGLLGDGRPALKQQDIVPLLRQLERRAYADDSGANNRNFHENLFLHSGVGDAERRSWGQTRTSMLKSAGCAGGAFDATHNKSQTGSDKVLCF